MPNLLQAVPESVPSTDMGLWLKADILQWFLCHFPSQLVQNPLYIVYNLIYYVG